MPATVAPGTAGAFISYEYARGFNVYANYQKGVPSQGVQGVPDNYNNFVTVILAVDAGGIIQDQGTFDGSSAAYISTDFSVFGTSLADYIANHDRGS